MRARRRTPLAAVMEGSCSHPPRGRIWQKLVVIAGGDATGASKRILGRPMAAVSHEKGGQGMRGAQAWSQTLNEVLASPRLFVIPPRQVVDLREGRLLSGSMNETVMSFVAGIPWPQPWIILIQTYVRVLL